MDEQNPSWKLIAICALIVGLPGYISVGFAAGAIVHFVMMALLLFALWCFGRRSILESTLMVFIIALLLAILLPVFLRVRENSLRGPKHVYVLFHHKNA